MSKKYPILVILAFVALFSSCKNEQRKDVHSNIVEIPRMDTIDVTVDKANICDSIFANFPYHRGLYDSLYLESEDYTGVRYIYEVDDILAYFECIDSHFNSNSLLKLVKMVSALEQNHTEGINITSSYLADLLESHTDEFFDVLDQCTVSEFKGLISFLYTDIGQYDSAIRPMCTALSSMAFKNPTFHLIVEKKCNEFTVWTEVPK